jgi:hypothetical protein
MAGRKSKYTDEKAQELIKLFVGGATIKDACAYVGISDDTLTRWCKRDADFAASVNKARATGKIECIALVRQAARSNWQAAAWFLERSDPTQWGRRDAMKITIEGDVPVELINQAIAAMIDKGVDPAEAFNKIIAKAHADAHSG